MEIFIIILTTIACTLGLTVSIWTILDARKRYPKKSRAELNEALMQPTRLPDEIEVRLENLARRTGRSKNFYARKAICAYLDDAEDLYLAEQVLQRIERGEESTSSLADVEARLNLAD
jgi:RHH-type rel operon transcriptional repressor/antitoxin RelB